MKRIISVVFVLALSVSLVAVPVLANTLASSTIHFESQTGFDLIDNGDGTYTGVIPCKVGAAFDIFAKEMATAWFYIGSTVSTQGIHSHDAWITWNPDTPDWYQYSLELWVEGGVQKWALRNHAGASDVNPWYTNPTSYPACGVPMSGVIHWYSQGVGYAEETGTGAYLPGMGTPLHAGWAASHGGGPACWDMDWSWGSEAVPLQYPGFHVTVTSGGSYVVTLTPAAATDTATGTGTACFSSSAGVIENLTPVSEGSLPAAAQATKPINFPDGLFSFDVTGLSNGQTVTVTITLPAGSAPTQYWKYHASEGGWIQIPMTIVGPPNVIAITLQDGGLGDDDGAANGVIVDQGGGGNPTVGWETYPVNKVRVFLPWIVLGVVIVAGGSLLVFRRRRTQS